MLIDSYREAIKANKDNQDAMGTLMGRAIKDTEVLPDQYTALCEEVIKIGFKFRYIIFV